MAKKHYDFSGWATRNDLQCSDGRTIRQDAFASQDGQEVPLVWGHDHEGPKTILGRALLENRPEGVYMYGSFNGSSDAQSAKEAVAHGDIKYLSIYANRLNQQLGNVLGGVIREVSLVPYGGANPGAYIDNAVIAHSDGTYSINENEAVIVTGYEIEPSEDLLHAEQEEKEVPNDEKKETKETEDTRTVQDIIDSMTEEQQDAMWYVANEFAKSVKAGAADDDKEDEDDDDEDDTDDAEDGDNSSAVEHSYEGEYGRMKYNAFENDTRNRSDVICHADQEEILKLAKDSRVGSFKNALRSYMEDNELMHGDSAAPVAGFDDVDKIDGVYTSFTAILPEYKEVRPGAPELVTDDQGWITSVIAKVHKSPISRIRTSQVDIRRANELAKNLRAKGYKKGAKKVETGQIKLTRRTTDPQTVYVKNALHRDDIADITDFDYVQYLYNIDRMMYNEEIATAIMIGDGRDDGDADKISPEHIRPIWTDDDLYTIHYDMTDEKSDIQGTNTEGYFGDNYIEAEAMVNACLYARENYKGTGKPDMFIHPHKLNVMLLARDRNGRRIYDSHQDLATALNVGTIYPVDKFENLTRAKGSDKMQLNAIIVNLADYSLGSTKGGQVTHFTQFDIDFNQEKSLLEGRQSGALTRIYSAIVLEEKVAAGGEHQS